MLANLGLETVVFVSYHMNWPGAGNDPWYLNNPTENTARRNYYGINAIPGGYIDGTEIPWPNILSAAYMTNVINNRSPISSPYEIDIVGDPGTASVSVKVRATSSPPSGSNYLRIAVAEKEYTASTPFPNGTTHHSMCMLDMVPDATGTLLNIAVGDSQTFNLNYNTSLVNLHPPSDISSILTIVAFIQNDQNNEVLQAGFDEVGLISEAITAGALINNTNQTTLNGFIYYNSSSSIDVDLGLTGTVPPGWNVTANCTLGSIPVNNSTSTFTLPGQDTLYYSINIDPQGISGGMMLDANLSLTSNPSVSASVPYSVTTNDVDILVVDAESENFETYVTSSLTNVYTGTYGVVSRSALHQPGVDLSNFDVIAWASGTTVPAFYQSEVNALQTYLDNGGRLFITGQDIGSDIFETTGQSQFAQSFYNNYLHADYLNNAINSFLINGYAGDPITDGLSFVVPYNPAGMSLEGIAPYDADATPIFKYMAGPNIGAIKASTNNYRVVYMGIGFEQVPTSATRDTILARSLRWFDDLTGIEPDNKIPLEFSLEQNYPNPFNPGTNIIYTLASQSEVSLKIYNNLGQEIRTLVNNLTQGINNYSVYWDGKDNSGNLVTSGVYFYHILTHSDKLLSKNGSQISEQSRKMLLIK